MWQDVTPIPQAYLNYSQLCWQQLIPSADFKFLDILNKISCISTYNSTAYICSWYPVTPNSCLFLLHGCRFLSDLSKIILAFTHNWVPTNLSCNVMFQLYQQGTCLRLHPQIGWHQESFLSCAQVPCQLTFIIKCSCVVAPFHHELSAPKPSIFSCVPLLDKEIKRMSLPWQ